MDKQTQTRLALLQALGEQSGAKGIDEIASGILSQILTPTESTEDELKRVYIENELQKESPDLQSIYNLMQGKVTTEDVYSGKGKSQVKSVLEQQQLKTIEELLGENKSAEASKIERLTPEQYGEYSSFTPDVNYQAETANVLGEKLASGDLGWIISNLFTSPGAKKSESLKSSKLDELLNTK